MVQNRKKTQKNSNAIIHFPESEGVSDVSKRVSAAEHASKASRAQPVNK